MTESDGGRRAGEAMESRSVHAIRLVRSGVHRFTDIEARGGFQRPEFIDECFALLVDALDVPLRSMACNTGKGRALTPLAASSVMRRLRVSLGMR